MRKLRAHVKQAATLRVRRAQPYHTFALKNFFYFFFKILLILIRIVRILLIHWRRLLLRLVVFLLLLLLIIESCVARIARAIL